METNKGKLEIKSTRWGIKFSMLMSQVNKLGHIIPEGPEAAELINVTWNGKLIRLTVSHSTKRSLVISLLVLRQHLSSLCFLSSFVQRSVIQGRTCRLYDELMSLWGSFCKGLLPWWTLHQRKQDEREQRKGRRRMKEQVIASFGGVFIHVWGISFPFESIVVSYLYMLAHLVVLHNSLCGNEANKIFNLAMS